MRLMLGSSSSCWLYSDSDAQYRMADTCSKLRVAVSVRVRVRVRARARRDDVPVDPLAALVALAADVDHAKRRAIGRVHCFDDAARALARVQNVLVARHVRVAAHALEVRKVVRGVVEQLVLAAAHKRRRNCLVAPHRVQIVRDVAAERLVLGKDEKVVDQVARGAARLGVERQVKLLGGQNHLLDAENQIAVDDGAV